MELQLATYPIGQGLCNTAAVIGDEGEVEFLGLFDCGSGIQVSRRWSSVSEWSYQKIKELVMSRSRTDSIFFDFIFVSHQDADHWNLIPNLLQRLIEESGIRGSYTKEGENETGMMFRTGDDVIDVYELKEGACSYKMDSDDLIVYWEQNSESSFQLEIEHMYTSENSRGGNTTEVDFRVKGTQNDVGDVSVRLELEDAENFGVIECVVRNNRSITTGFMENKTTHARIDGNIENALLGSTVLHAFEEAVRFIREETLLPEDIVQPVRKSIVVCQKYTREFIEAGVKECRQFEQMPKIVHSVFLAGEETKKSYQNLAVKLSKYSKQEVETSVVREIEMSNGWGIIPFAVAQKARAEQLYQGSNAFQGTLQDHMVRNLTSQMLEIVDIAKNNEPKALLPGDATVHTMLQINREGSKDYTLLIAPHHGSDVTASYKRACDQAPQFDVLIGFLEWANARNVFISSGYGNIYKHPGTRFVDEAMKTVTTRDAHSIYKPANRNPFETTNKAVYTTVAGWNQGKRHIIGFRRIEEDAESIPMFRKEGLEKEVLKKEVPEKELFLY